MKGFSRTLGKRTFIHSLIHSSIKSHQLLLGAPPRLGTRDPVPVPSKLVGQQG